MRRHLISAMVLAVCLTGCSSSSDEKPPEPRSKGWSFDYVTKSRDATVTNIAPTARDRGWALLWETSAEGGDRDILLRREGKEWRRAGVSPLTEVKGWLQSNVHMVASGPKNVWLMARAENEKTGEVRNRASRFDGEKWHRMSIPFSALDVEALPTGDLWALDSTSDGDGAPTWHWDGKRWTRHRLSAREVDHFFADGEGGVWAVGSRDVGKTRQPALAHYDGKRWRTTPTPEYRSAKPRSEEEAVMHSLVSVGPDEAWAFGRHEYVTGPGGTKTHTRPIAMRWDGERWRKATADFLPKDGEGMVDLDGAAPDGRGGFVVESRHRSADGTTYRIQDPPLLGKHSGRARKQEVNAVSVAHVPGTHEIWASGGASLSEGSGTFSRGVIMVYSAGG